MIKGLQALKRIGELILYSEYAEYPKVKGLADYKIIEKELKDQRKKLTIISEILVDISKGNYSDLKVAIKEIREALD